MFQAALASVLAEVQSLLQIPSLQITAVENAGSPGSRSEIRQAVVTELAKQLPLTEIERETLLRLDIVPWLTGASVSISHTPTHAAFASLVETGTAARSRQIGFDIEERGRVSEKAVARVSQPEELRSAPSPALLWVAKEAAYKALRGTKQPKVMSAVTITSWVSIGRSVRPLENLSLWTCELSEDSLVKGVCVELNGTCLGVFAT